MNKYLITWDGGMGEEVEVVEAKSQAEADKIAYEKWKHDAEQYAQYSALLIDLTSKDG